MHFDVIKLNDRLNKLQELLSKTSDKNRTIELKRDIMMIKMMLAYVTSQKYDINLKEEIYDESYGVIMEELSYFFKKNYSELGKALFPFSNRIRLPYKRIKDTKISYDEMQLLIRNFLQFYDKNLYELYEKLVSDGRVELSPNKFNVHENALGLNIHLSSFDESYVLSRFNNKINSVATLPHELAHAYITKGANSTEKLLRRNISLFSEAYSIFLEFVFNDYLKDTRFEKNARSGEYVKIDAFLLYCEYLYPEIFRFKNVFVSNNELYFDSKEVACIKIPTLTLSSMLAMYFYDLYRNDKKNFKYKIDAFIEMFGDATDDEIINYFGIENISFGTRNTVCSFIKEYKK